MPYKDREKLYKAQRAYRERNKVKRDAYLSEHPCADCGETDIEVLQFDHRGDKKFDIGNAIHGSTRSWKLIETEIEKCDVRCANCHIRITNKRRRDKQGV